MLLGAKLEAALRRHAIWLVRAVAPDHSILAGIKGAILSRPERRVEGADDQSEVAASTRAGQK